MNYDDEIDYLEKRKLEYEKFLKEKAIKLEIGKIYLQESDSWAKKHYLIEFVNDKVALGKVAWCGIYESKTKGCGDFELFNVNTGEKYQDSRLAYRLINEVRYE